MTFELTEYHKDNLLRAKAALNATSVLIDPDLMTLRGTIEQKVEGEEVLNQIASAQHTLNCVKKYLSRVTKDILKNSD